MGMTPRRLGRAAGVLALGLLAACSSGGQAGEQHGPGQTGAVGTAAAAGVGGGVIGEPVVVTLEEDESVLSVSPSGDHLVTVTEPTVPEGQDDWVVEVCVRSGPGYQTAECADGGALARYPRGAAWSADESILAFVYPSNQKVNVVCLLDVATGEVRAVTDPDERVEIPVVLTWLADGRVGFTWATADGTEIRAVDPTVPGAPAETLQSIPEATIDGLFAGGSGLLAEGEIGQEQGVFDLGDGATSPELRVPTARASAVVAVDSIGERITVQRWDTHTALPLAVVETTSGAEVELGETDPARYASAADFAPDDQHLLTLSYVDVHGELAIRDRSMAIVETLTFDRPRDSFYYDGVDWTERGIFLTTSTQGQAQRVSIFPVEPLGS
ncbi:hypothetical protein [Ornithinimicrobium faecis]|uniref:hypothetical protein n=1 Tax=Ornithinimicrobium faecis TaxID=2934158 RepID=UPI002119B061|nr:hypothetical protein [Ornithinimicrobium sp. HY1745]